MNYQKQPIPIILKHFYQFVIIMLIIKNNQNSQLFISIRYIF